MYTVIAETQYLYWKIWIYTSWSSPIYPIYYDTSDWWKIGAFRQFGI